MKVLHLSTYDTGGAAIAALRLHEGLLRIGIDSSFLSLHQSKPGGDPRRSRFLNAPLSLPARLLRHLNMATSKKVRHQKFIEELGGNLEIYSTPVTDFAFLENHKLVEQADVINLHWIANFVNFDSFFRHVRKRIVWTLHDMNPFMGGFHYENDRVRNIKAFSKIEATLSNIKYKSVRESNDLTIVCPSSWLANAAKASKILSDFPIQHIPYSLDVEVFKDRDRSFARDVFNLPSDKRIVLFVSASLKNRRKGYDLLVSAIDLMHGFDDVAFVAVGDSSPGIGDRVIRLGRIDDDRLMSLLYSAADVFVLPSREDNFPNVMLESMACGTPVVSFANGGMAEVVHDGFNGLLVREQSPDQLALALSSVLSGEVFFQRDKIRDFAVENFALEVQAKRYARLYNIDN